MSIFSARTFLPGPVLDSETRQSGLPAAATGTGYPESLDVNVPPSVARRAQLHPNGRATSGVEGHPTQRQNVEGDEHVRQPRTVEPAPRDRQTRERTASVDAPAASSGRWSNPVDCAATTATMIAAKMAIRMTAAKRSLRASASLNALSTLVEDPPPPERIMRRATRHFAQPSPRHIGKHCRQGAIEDSPGESDTRACASGGAHDGPSPPPHPAAPSAARRPPPGCVALPGAAATASPVHRWPG